MRRTFNVALTMTKPVRLQLSRKAGFNLQAASRAINGLEAVNVARPSKWGNPYKVGTCLIPDRRAAVEAFAANLPIGKIAGIDKLRGKNLACWCHKGQECHADILIKIANS
jgi:hypothetical protein